jgi:hypothetical protein
MQKMHCVHCGAEIIQDARFCTGCGVGLLQDPKAKKAGKKISPKGRVLVSLGCLMLAIPLLLIFSYGGQVQNKSLQPLFGFIIAFFILMFIISVIRLIVSKFKK